MTAGTAAGPAGLIAAAVRDCLRHELGTAPAAAGAPGRVRVAAVGTTAANALKSALLAEALAAELLEPAASVPYPGTGEILAAPDWGLGLVLSPFKAEASARADALSPSARATGIVDTLLRTDGGTLGVNTNSWALAAAAGALLQGVTDPRVLVLGAGGTTRSALLGLHRAMPGAQLLVSARRAEAVAELTARFAVTAVAPADTPAAGATLIINATTWGETAESEAAGFGFPVQQLLRPGCVLLDLNNRRSQLQETALASGCVVMGGTLMQRVTHACRAAGARWAYDRLAVED